MPMKTIALVLAAALTLAAHPAHAAATNAEFAEEVRQAEAAFAQTMADRNHGAFVSFLAEEAIFAGATVLRGKAEIAAAWKKFYEGKDAPFSWQPETVAVVSSGTLAISRGPVFDASGKKTGTFISTWRREADGQWKIVLDTGCPPCECGDAKP